MPNAVVLLSGGLDSATCLALARSQGHKVHALTISYGQRHSIEIEKAKVLASRYHAVHMVLPVELSRWAGSSLFAGKDVPKDRDSLDDSKEIPSTYVPARNTVFLSLALAYAESLNARHIFIGANAVDYSGYPDCRPEFIRAFEETANKGTRMGIQGKRIFIHAPLLFLKKSQIVRLGRILGVDFSLTLSCYDPDKTGTVCGKCDSCILRARGFAEAGVKDPTVV